MPEPRGRLTVVYNPIKVEDLDADRRVVAEACRRHGWDEPRWIETTAEETGEKQAREAVEAGADVVATLGGDGTVRAVATALVGTDVALGLLPGGTGNLLARNLDLPVDSTEHAMGPLLSGTDLRLDVGFVTADDDAEEVFLIMTGLGFDGEIMAGTNERVKGLLGWPAYLLAGARNLLNRGFTVEVASSGADGVTGAPGDALRRQARSAIVGNCGMLQGGIDLMPDADYRDGILDAVVIAPKGAFGWASVVADVSTRHRVGHKRLDRLRGKEFTILADRPIEAEIDGDPIGPRTRLAVRIEPSSLVVRHA
ncbi:diacylglycerol kinase family protein [Intrasporangium calvum]|uniref:Diacylglycerol kinase family protein n=1 Tax=Intrasporangium calvum TaxID=53358 RepID=A0ABT5GEP2_9MICO|nr:diacylglycerol kinase family protein [Intrasporangium calvum]MDC5696618.1 diacylglycerol kinase family protein [Intrasporangium calvum]